MAEPRSENEGRARELLGGEYGACRYTAVVDLLDEAETRGAAAEQGRILARIDGDGPGDDLETMLNAYTRGLADGMAEADRIRTELEEMIEHVQSMRSYLGHQDQDADHTWMADKMRDALVRARAALAMAPGGG